MKKMFAVMIALVMMLASVSAFAEVSSYVVVGFQDAEGNVIVSDEIPVLVFGIDNESNECAFGNEEEQMEGTWEFGEATEEGVIVLVTLADGSQITLVYVEANDAFAYVDAEGIVYVMMNVEALAELAA